MGADRDDTMTYRRCGRSGLKLPAVSLGLWHNFGDAASYDAMRRIVRSAFEHGVCHFDLANNYGPPPGSAETNFGRLLRDELRGRRDELVISTKAGYTMWNGPYGDGGSRKYLLSSLDQSLARLGIEYVDVFYHRRPDPETPLEETMGALDQAVCSGRALYAGVSNYPADRLRAAATLLRQMGTPCVIHQPRYNLFDRGIEDGLLGALADEGVGCIAFSPLAQGLLTDRYLDGTIPVDSRAALGGFLTPEQLTDERLAAGRRLQRIARERGQSLAQMALAWVRRHPGMSSVLIGASRPAQVEEAVAALRNLAFTADELARIDAALAPGGR